MTNKKSILYRAGQNIGLGHLLVSISFLANYGRKTDRTLYVSLEGSVLESVVEADVDPMFSSFLDIRKSQYDNVCVSKSAIRYLIDKSQCDGGSTLLVGRADHPNRLRSIYPEVLSNHSGVIDRFKFRPLVQQGIDFPERLMIVDSVVPVEARPGQEGHMVGVEPIAPFSDEMMPRNAVKTEECTYLSVHVRHGNGENLGLRPRGGSEEHQQFVQKAILQAGRLAKKYNYDNILAFSDNADIVDEIRIGCGASAGNRYALGNQKFQVHLKAMSTRSARLRAIQKDFQALAKSDLIVATPSLFALAAQMWPKKHEIQWVH
jgi:hypothetical protein